MQQKSDKWTLTDLVTTFHVTKSTLRSHLEAHGLNEQLSKNHHMIKDGYKYLFDDVAVLKIAETFKGKISNRKKGVSNSGMSKSTFNHLSKDMSNINDKLDMIMNHLHISY